MSVQKARIDTPPILLVLEGTHLFVRLAPFETTLQKTSSRMLVPRESALNLLDHIFYVAHSHSQGFPSLLSFTNPTPAT
jgi:hypothetical protein